MIIKPGLSQSDEFHPAGVTNGAAWYSLKVGFHTEANLSRLLNFSIDYVILIMILNPLGFSPRLCIHKQRCDGGHIRTWM